MNIQAIKKMMWIISMISLVGTIIGLGFMPEKIPMHYDMEGNIDRWGSKYESLIFPVLIILITLFWFLLTVYYEKKLLKLTDEKEISGVKSNAKVLSIVGVCMALGFTVMQGFMLYQAYIEAVSGALKWKFDLGNIYLIIGGIIIMVLGSLMTKTRINNFVGVRIVWSMYNDNTWEKSNRFGAYAFMAVGFLAILFPVIIDNSFTATMLFLGSLLLATILTVIYAHKVYIEEIKAEKKE